MTPAARNRRKARDGFALLITLTLLAFLLVLFVGLATYARIETAVAGNVQRQAQARQNARLALDLALAHLQKHAGPDQRVTATAASFGGAPGTRYYTGVWDAAAAGGVPRTWLVSGNEADPLAVTPDAAPTETIELVGRNTSGVARDIVAPLVDLSVSGVRGRREAIAIGRYAWWVGDQGVKAAVGAWGGGADIDYPPYGSAEARARLRQQRGAGAGPFELEPRSGDNAALLENIAASSQLAWLRRSGGAVLGGGAVREHFHSWTANNFAVLADSRRGGLRQDLSLQPELLGPAFAAWVESRETMEDPASPLAPPPLPAYGADPVRRRHRISPPVASRHAGIAPILTYFYLLFGVRKQNAAAPYTLSLRWAAALWNPFTGGLVPEDLRLEISGLPESLAFIDARTGAADASVSLRQLYGDALRVTLPWIPATSPPRADRQTWLPGRVYNWVNAPGAGFQAGAAHPGRFYSRDLGGFADGLIVTVPGTPAVNGNTPLSVRLDDEVTLEIKLVRERDGAVLATYTSPTYEAVAATAPDNASRFKSQLGFLFRLGESLDNVVDPGAWLTTRGIDPRDPALPPAAWRAVPNGPNPAAYANYITISAPDRLLDRDITRGTSYNEDVPLFELPRAPLLSLGMLQHFHLPGSRPFAIGNAWGVDAQVAGMGGNDVFDRFFFSGLAPDVSPPDGVPSARLPNAWLVPVTGKDGTATTIADLREAPEAKSSRHLLQGGAFNVNSTEPRAWAAMLRAGRVVVPPGFSYLDADPTTGTGGDDTLRVDGATDARFFRFSQSAQEVFEADDDYAQSTTSTTGTGPAIATPLFRRGMRTLGRVEIEALANAIVANVRSRHAAVGPFRSLAEFLGPDAVFAGRSAIEQAIGDAGLNDTVAEFSAQWLTQADVVTALAPVLGARSDTFLVRAYGETVNPATGATDGRAWCEAIVQRTPEYFDPVDAPEVTPLALSSEVNKTYGRRFKVVSFRWLTRADI